MQTDSKLVHIYSQIRDRCGHGTALDAARIIARHHRIQASPGYRAAAEACVGWLGENGVSAQILSYPASLDQWFFTQRSFQEWTCEAAYLDLTDPVSTRLADFGQNDMSLIQRSAPADYRDRDLSVVYVDNRAVSPEEFHRPLQDCLLFVPDAFDRWVDRAAQLGAAGILTVSMPEIPPVRVQLARDPQMADACANLSFHRLNSSDHSLFGFALTPSQGEYLKALCQSPGSHEGPKARAYVRSTLYDGALENVSAVIPGRTSREILMVAHLCHPKSSVNDNASGAACAMEAMGVLQSLVWEGALPVPWCTIRLLLVPEFTGTYAYLSQNRHRLEEIIAGVNLDMVGARQDGTAGPFLSIEPPDALPTFVGDLMGCLLEEAGKECSLSSGGHTSLFQWQCAPFMPGSDHAILCDPTVGVPTVALTQWPDKAYHTSGDCLERLDGHMLRRVSGVAAAYAYLLAALEPDDIPPLLRRTRQRFYARITQLGAMEANGVDIASRGGRCLEQALDTCNDYRRYFSGSQADAVEPLLQAEQAYYRRLFALHFPGADEVAASGGRDGAVYRRRFIGPLSLRSVLAVWPEALVGEYRELERAHSDCEKVMDAILYRVNGNNTPDEIASMVRDETGVECGEYTQALLALLERAELLTTETECQMYGE